MAKKKGRFRFLKGMLIYIFVFALLAAAVLAFLYSYFEEYEQAGSKACIRDYFAQLKQGAVPENIDTQLVGLDLRVRSAEDNDAWVVELLSEAGYAKLHGESNENAESYSVISRGMQIGKVRIEKSGEGKYGLERWHVTEESYDLSGFKNTQTFYLPEDYSLQVGNATISAGGETKEYEALGYVYERYAEMPMLHLFESGSYLGDVDVKILDAGGNELSEEQLTEQYFLNNCDEELQKKLVAFGEEFVKRYIDYGAVNGGTFLYNFLQFKDIMLTGGELYNRVNTNWGAVLYSSTEYCNILDLKVNFCCRLDDNLFLVDVSYTTETKGTADPVVGDNRVRIVGLEDVDGQLVASQMYYY